MTSRDSAAATEIELPARPDSGHAGIANYPRFSEALHACRTKYVQDWSISTPSNLVSHVSALQVCLAGRAVLLEPNMNLDEPEHVVTLGV